MLLVYDSHCHSSRVTLAHVKNGASHSPELNRITDDISERKEFMYIGSANDYDFPSAICGTILDLLRHAEL